MSPDDETKRATALLRGRVVHQVVRQNDTTVLVEFADGARLHLDVTAASLELSITGMEESGFSAGLYGELDEGTAQWQEPADPELIRDRLLQSDFVYGSEFRLRTPGPRLVVALSVTATSGTADAGQFLVYVDDELIAQNVDRATVLGYFLAALSSTSDLKSPSAG